MDVQRLQHFHPLFAKINCRPHVQECRPTLDVSVPSSGVYDIIIFEIWETRGPASLIYRTNNFTLSVTSTRISIYKVNGIAQSLSNLTLLIIAVERLFQNSFNFFEKPPIQETPKSSSPKSYRSKKKKKIDSFFRNRRHFSSRKFSVFKENRFSFKL